MESKEKIKNDFGQQLQKIRVEKGLSIRKLAGSPSLEYSHVQGIENGLVDVALTTIYALAEGLEVEPSLRIPTTGRLLTFFASQPKLLFLSFFFCTVKKNTYMRIDLLNIKKNDKDFCRNVYHRLLRSKKGFTKIVKP